MAQAANAGSAPVKARKGQIGKYKKWGYIFMLPFILVFLVFQAWPLIQTFYYSMFKYFKSGLSWIGPEFVGFDNFVAIFDMSSGNNILALTWNTLIMWVLGFVPQIIISLLFAYWFTNVRLRLRCLVTLISSLSSYFVKLCPVSESFLYLRGIICAENVLSN